MQFTPSAAKEITKIMIRDGLSPETHAVRMGVKGGGCSGFQYGFTFDEKKEVLRIVDQSMVNSANNVLANDDPPGKPLKRLPTKHKSEVQAKAVQMGRKLFIKIQVDELIKTKRKNNIKIIK